MIQLSARTFAASFVVICALIGFAARAADLLPAETRLASLAGSAAPKEISFTIATAEDLVVTLTDLQTPSPLTTASIVVTQADAIAGSATFTAPATSATVQLLAAQGEYTMRVFGAPNPDFSVGTFSACVAPKSDPTNCIQTASFSDNILAKSAANDPTLSTLSLNLTVTTAGSYTFTFADLGFPAALNSAPNIALFQGSVAVPGALGIPSGTTLALNAGTYTLLATAQADQTLRSGLYGITITGPSGTAALLDDVIPVGLTSPAAPVNNAATQSVTLKVSDFGYPSALASASALLTSGSMALGTASAAGGATMISAPAGTLKVWTFANPGSGSGTYSVDLSAGPTSIYSAAASANVSGSASFAYAFSTPVDAGAYQASAADLQFPSNLNGLTFAVAQNGTILAQSSAAGSLNVTASAGPIVLLVNAQTPSSGSTTANGLFDVNLQTTGASASLVFDQTQSVGAAPALFDTQTITLGTNGSFDATLTDLKFPAQFQNLALVISRGTEVLGKIFGGGTFTFAGTPGKYQVTFVATPAADQKYGLYAVKAVVSPPLVNLSASTTTAVVGDTIQLNWSASGADSCVASGGSWTGDKAVTATSEGVVLSATTTYTLSCTGPGGTSSKSVSVTATPKPASSSGGGGAMDWRTLALLAGMLAWRGRLNRTGLVTGRCV